MKKTGCNIKVTEIENKLNNQNHAKCIDSQELNTLAADVFNARIAQGNLVTKTDYDAKFSSRHKKLPQIKQNTYLLKTN